MPACRVRTAVAVTTASSWGTSVTSPAPVCMVSRDTSASRVSEGGGRQGERGGGGGAAVRPDSREKH